MSRRHAVATGCVLAVTALTLTAAPGVATSGGERTRTAVSGKPVSGMLEALQRDLRLTGDQVQERLLNETRLTGVAAELRGRLGDRFGGSWLMGTIAQTLVVATTDPADIPLIIAAGARAEVVKRSLADLNGHLDNLNRAVAGHRSGGVVRYVDVQNNRVVILSAKPLAVEDLIQSAGADTSVVKVALSIERPRLLVDVQGGDAYYVGGAGRCSVGFSVTHGVQSGFVSAGHCGRRGTATTGFNRASQGVFQASDFPGRDQAWVAVNANWTIRPVVSGGGDTVPVAGSRQALEGASVCRSGRTGWHCGIVRQPHTSVTYPQGTVYELVRTSVCAGPGDSGSPFVSVDQAQGVTSGGSGDCTAGGITYFQPINPILAAHGLTLVTGNGASISPAPQPSPVSCDGYPKTYTGALGDGESAFQPGGRYYRTGLAGLHSACLRSDEGVDFDLYLQRWRRPNWVTVAESTSPRPDEQISYTGPPGAYRYHVVSVNGSSLYTLRFRSP